MILPSYNTRPPEETASAFRVYSALDAENKKRRRYENMQCDATGMPITRCKICNGLRKHPMIARVCVYCGAEMKGD